MAQFYGDETDTVPGCIPRPSIIRTDLEPINEEGIRPKQTAEEWHLVSPDFTSLQKIRLKRGPERRVRSVRLPDVGSFKEWMCGHSIDLDNPTFLRGNSSAAASENVLAYNAVLHARSQNWRAAYRDAEKSIDLWPSTVGYIAKALARVGMGDLEQALQTFELAFSMRNPRETILMLLIKGILLFVAGKYDEAVLHVHGLITIPQDDETVYFCSQVLAKMYLERSDFEGAVHSLERQQAFASSNNGYHLESILFIFGWSFEGIGITARQRLCEALHSAGRTVEAAEVLGKILKSIDGEPPTSEEVASWTAAFGNKCVDRLKVLGDQALSSGEHGEAIVRYSSALSLDPSNKIDILAKRSKAQAAKGLWEGALADAEESINIRPSVMGYVAKALAQIGAGELEQAIQKFDLAFWNCSQNESRFLLLMKAIIFFVTGKCDEAISRVHDLIAIGGDNEMMYYCNQVVAMMHFDRANFERAVRSLNQARTFASSNNQCRLESISLMFGWRFEGFEITAWKSYCEDLHTTDRTEEAANALGEVLNNFDGEIRASKEVEKWVTDFKNKCVEGLKGLGDKALESEEHGKAIEWYSSALSLKPLSPKYILVKRSNARALKGLWADALADANEVIKLDPSSHQGYERKCVALHGSENYTEANNSLLRMLSIIEKSPDDKIRGLKENYTTPRDATHVINAATREILNFCPLVLIDLTTGRMCDANRRVQMFHSETPFKKLVSEIAIMKLDYPHVRQAVAKYFQWIMFSHTWEGEEPTFQEVNLVDSVWSLDQSPLNEKLRQFCTTAHKDGHRWAWSDTCCIDKTTSAILSQSITSMYRWYEEATETLVYLVDVLSSAELGELTKSRWMTRAWTLQELLASKVIRFYTRDWTLYLNETCRNHKESPSIKQELAEAIGIAAETITSFRPKDLGVREKLRLASTRNATVEEDIAYSLIGIFSSDIVPRYGLGKTALGHLLENVVASTGDITVIAWTGKSLSYNTALPDSLTVYRQTPYSPPLIEADELDAGVERLRTGSATQKDATAFYRKLTRLPRATFSNRCLQLPCIRFSVTKIVVQDQGGKQGTLYRATVSLLGKVEFRTSDTMPLKKPRKLVFVHPWFRDLYDPLDELDSESDDESEDVSEVDSDDEPEDESDVVSGDGTDDASPFKHSARVLPYTQALRLIVRLGRPFNALLLERQTHNQYKRVAAEQEIIISGVPHQTNPKDLRARAKPEVLEII